MSGPSLVKISIKKKKLQRSVTSPTINAAVSAAENRKPGPIFSLYDDHTPLIYLWVLWNQYHPPLSGARGQNKGRLTTVSALGPGSWAEASGSHTRP